ncbi:bifunctional oligoribonuclease/PAP phosphatase NrnA [Nautilia sp. PV-1]|uniref:DHH family phosphoesterase n=1 Tax=Nautilia sp. PV-1 TaxID=2579250 RepID=UPI000FD9E17F|nr:bifunctional oligoribonuclease/PAP phosphatase NrnA [Nautilia sp. PV-1]AZV47227.1 bifunctional oligoribonuclease/PAP phosphatase NrnA [Nautilia sp. PV-1]
MDIYKQIWKEIEKADNIMLIAHINPDGDALGSSLSLYPVLKKMGKKVTVFNATKPLPQYLDFLPNFNKVTNNLPKKIDLTISFDCGSFDRLGLEEKPSFLINIDHHVSNTKYGDINLIEPDYASTSQVVYDILKANGIEIDKDSALCIYTALVTDTGSFQYESVNDRVFECAADLVRCGAEPDYVAKMLFQRDRLSRLRLLAKAYETIELCCDGKVAFVEVTKEMMEITGAIKDDTDTIVNSVRALAPVEVACMLREDDEGIKVSLRSKNYADVSKVAVKHGGGGHIRAAGATIRDEFDFEKVKNILKEDLKEIV